MTFNVELAQKTMEQIEENPDYWVQTSWHCGSSYCFGGWAAVLSGYRPLNVRADGEQFYECIRCYEYVALRKGDARLLRQAGIMTAALTWPDVCSLHGIRGVKVAEIQYVATLVLGLNNNQAQQLFESSNSMGALRDCIEDYAKAEAS